MNLRKERSSYWISFYDQDNRYIYDGFWVLFIRNNVDLDANQKKSFIKHVQKFMLEEQISAAKIALPYYDRLIIFTSCVKQEINDVKQRVLKHFSISARDMVWKTDYESMQGWGRDGWLKLMSETYSGYEHLLQSNNVRIPSELIRLKSKAFQQVLEIITMNRTSMVIKPVFNGISYTEDSESIFVLMPFRETWSDDVYHLIKKAGNDTNFDIKRADDFFEPNIIIDDIWQHINKASLIIADITAQNANVFYELGIAHTIGKKVVLIKQRSGGNAPFDIRAWRYIEYDTNPKAADEFVQMLKKIFLLHESRSNK